MAKVVASQSVCLSTSGMFVSKEQQCDTVVQPEAVTATKGQSWLMIWDSHSQPLTQMLDSMKAHAGKMMHHGETSKDLLKASWGEEHLANAAVYETDTNYPNRSSCSKAFKSKTHKTERSTTDLFIFFQMNLYLLPSVACDYCWLEF